MKTDMGAAHISGQLSPNKGVETVIEALPDILARNSNVIYIVAGATHPHIRRREGDRPG